MKQSSIFNERRAVIPPRLQNTHFYIWTFAVHELSVVGILALSL